MAVLEADAAVAVSHMPSGDLPHRRATLGRMMSVSMTLLLFVTGALIIMLALAILFNENHNATKGYKLRTLQRERSQLLLMEEVLKMRIAEAQALRTFQSDPQIASMVEARRPQYIEDDSAIAQNNDSQE